MNERERYGLENGLNRGEFVSSRRSINRLNRLLVNGEFELRVKYPSLRSYFHHGCARGSLYARQFPYDRWVCVYIPRQRGVCTRFDDSILAFVLHEDEDEIDGRVSWFETRPSREVAFFSKLACDYRSLSSCITARWLRYDTCMHIYHLSNDNMQLGQSDRSLKVTSAYHGSKYNRSGRLTDRDKRQKQRYRLSKIGKLKQMFRGKRNP